MSKAFTKEDQGENLELDLEAKEEEASSDPLSGKKNYMTPQGAEKLRSELKQLLNDERPELVKVIQWAASNGDRSENADYIYGKSSKSLKSSILLLSNPIKFYLELQ